MEISLKLEPWHDSCQRLKWKPSLSQGPSSVQRQPYFFLPPLLSLILHTQYLVPSLSRPVLHPWWLNMAVWLVCSARNTCRLPSCLTEHHYRLSERQCGPVCPSRAALLVVGVVKSLPTPFEMKLYRCLARGSATLSKNWPVFPLTLMSLQMLLHNLPRNYFFFFFFIYLSVCLFIHSYSYYSYL